MILASAPDLTLLLACSVIVGYLVPAVWTGLRGGSARLLLLAVWVLHASLLAASLFGATPRFGFGPALSVTVWLVVAVYAIESQFYPQLQIRRVMCVLASAAVLVALVFPGLELHARASFWLPLHLALGIGSYGLFGAAVAHAWLMGRAEEQIRKAADPHSAMPLLTLERLIFRFVGAGFVLLTATIVAALFYGESLYGTDKGWVWNHKAVFSILSWITFATLLLGRMRFGWRGQRAARVLYGGATLLLLAYVGSRFVMEVVLGRVS